MSDQTKNIDNSAEHATDQRHKSQRGVTLVELLVVLAIFALISGVVVVNVLPERDRAMVRTAKIDIGTISSALDQYRLGIGRYPTEGQGLEALSTAPSDLRNTDDYRRGGYVKAKQLLDPWGNPYQYRYPGENSEFDLYSLGADGKEGGEGNDADIGNWSDN